MATSDRATCHTSLDPASCRRRDSRSYHESRAWHVPYAGGVPPVVSRHGRRTLVVRGGLRVQEYDTGRIFGSPSLRYSAVGRAGGVLQSQGRSPMLSVTRAPTRAVMTTARGLPCCPARYPVHLSTCMTLSTHCRTCRTTGVSAHGLRPGADGDRPWRGGGWRSGGGRGDSGRRWGSRRRGRAAALP